MKVWTERYRKERERCQRTEAESAATIQQLQSDQARLQREAAVAVKELR